MAKRLTDTQKWNDEWYLNLSNDYRIIWQWLLDNCSHAGFCKRSVSLLNLMCRTSITEQELLEKMEGRVIVHGSDWFIPKFIKFQYKCLYVNKPAVISVVRELFCKNAIGLIPQSFGNDYLIIQESFFNYCKIIKDKDMDKDKDNKKNKPYKRIIGVSVDENLEYVTFNDGSTQALGPQQKQNINNGHISAREIIKGNIY